MIANAFAEYYISLYNLTCDPATPQSSDCEIQTFLAQINLPTLSDTQLLSLNAPLTEAEINKIINSLPADKSPGPDSINKEYLKIFKNILTPFLLPVFNKAIKTTLPPPVLTAHDLTLPKPGKDPNSPANSCPNSLCFITCKNQ